MNQLLTELVAAGSEMKGAGARKWIGQKRSCYPGDDDGAVSIEVRGAEFAVRKIIEPLPGFSAVAAGVDARECRDDHAIRSRRIDLDAVGAHFRPGFILCSMQKKPGVGYSLYRVLAGGVVDTPACSKMKPSTNVMLWIAESSPTPSMRVHCFVRKS